MSGVRHYATSAGRHSLILPEVGQRWRGANGDVREILTMWPRTDSAEAALRVRTDRGLVMVIGDGAFRAWVSRRRAVLL